MTGEGLCEHEFKWIGVTESDGAAGEQMTMNKTLAKHRDIFRLLRLHQLSFRYFGTIATFSPSMGFELSPSAWGHLWSILKLNISNFNLLSFPFEPE